jgi:DNA-binding winged helix-turn-helix (wHTH) protein
VRLQLADLTVDSDSRQLWSGAKEVHLSPKAFDLLALLIERRPRAVSKADIHERLWPGTFVSDSSLPSLVSEVREAIADHKRKPRLLRTLHGFGYAFQAPDQPAPQEAARAVSSGPLRHPALRSAVEGKGQALTTMEAHVRSGVLPDPQTSVRV